MKQKVANSRRTKTEGMHIQFARKTTFQLLLPNFPFLKSLLEKQDSYHFLYMMLKHFN